MPELQAIDDERGGVLIVGADGERGVLCRAQVAAVLVPAEGDGQVSLENLKFSRGTDLILKIKGSKFASTVEYILEVTTTIVNVTLGAPWINLIYEGKFSQIWTPQLKGRGLGWKKLGRLIGHWPSLHKLCSQVGYASNGPLDGF